MKDNELQFDRSCHALYSKACKKQIRSKIALHYPEARQEAVWERVQRQYAEFLSDWRTDLGGKRNFHNGVGGTYDCIAIHELPHSLQSCHILPRDRGDGGKPDPADLLQAAVCGLQQAVLEEADVQSVCAGETGCDKWHDYEMTVAPYEADKPIYYEFTSCPAAEFAIRHGLTGHHARPVQLDFASMELLHARLVRTTTCVDGCKCDYIICGDRDEYLKEHPRICG